MFYKVFTNHYICFTKHIIMGKSSLGEFEELTLTLVGILGDEAYGLAVVNEFKSKMDRDVNLSAVHVTLYRLEDKGLIRSEMRGATASRGGRRKRYFTISNAGIEVLQHLKEQRSKLWNLMPQLKFSIA